VRLYRVNLTEKAKLGCRARESQVRLIQATQVNLGLARLG